MKLLPILTLSLFCSCTFANSDLQQNNAIHTPTVEKNISVVEKTTEAKRQADASLKKKNEAKEIASSVKRDFASKVKRAWHIPANSSGQRATARVTLNDNGSVATVSVNASDPDIKESVEQAVHAAAPYPMPSDPDARRQAQTFNASFKVE